MIEIRNELLVGRAMKLTALLRHDEAIAAYRRAIAETPSDHESAAVIRFNLACELAKQGAPDYSAPPLNPTESE